MNRKYFDSILKLKSVKTVEGTRDLAKLKSEVTKYESLLKDKIDTSGKLGEVYQDLGEEYVKRENWEQAINALEKSIGYGHSSMRTHYLLGAAYSNYANKTDSLDKYKKSEFHYKESLKHKPTYFQARYGLALVQYYGLKKKKLAVKHIEKVVLENPKFYSARFAQARIYYEEKNLPKSLSTYENLLVDLKKNKKSKKNEKEKKQVTENINRIMLELSGTR